MMQQPGIYGDFAYAHHFTMVNPKFIYNSEDIQMKLQEKLKPVQGAWLDTNKVCMEGTRVSIIKEISNWINTIDSGTPRVYFLCGEAGTGKSTISHTIGKEFLEYLGAFFCFSRTFATERTPSNALRTIAYDLGIKFPDIEQGLLKVVDNPHILSTTNLHDLWKALIVGPAKQFKNPFKPVIIIIDALDECGSQEQNEPREKLLSLLMNNSQDLPKNFHIFVTTRLESDVITYIERFPTSIQVQYMNRISNTNEDIYKYVCNQMMNTGSRRGMLKEGQCKILADKAEGFFQWAHTVYDLFDPNDEDAMTAYGVVMSELLAAFEPLSQASLKRLQLASNDMDNDDESSVDYVIPFLGSLLTGVDKSELIVKPVHASVRDFLLDEGRSKHFVVNIKEGHRTLAKGTLNVMIQHLHFNMCKLEDSYLLNVQVKDLQNKILRYISHDLLYACCTWDLHLQRVEQQDWCLSILEKFFYKYSLYWMEVLGLTKNIHVASRVTTTAGNFVKNFQNGREKKELEQFIQEIPLFVQVFGKMITDSTPHLYLSGLPFIPKGSTLHARYTEKFGKLVTFCKGHQSTWPYEQATLQGHTSQVVSVAFSPNGQRLVSGSWDGSVRIWNAESGEPIGSPLLGIKGVNSVAFSPDGKKVASGSADNSVIIWDAETGEAVGQPLQGHTHQVSSIAFSPDGQKIVSGSWDKSLRVWNTETQAAVSMLQGHAKGIKAVAFSPDGDKIVSGSDDCSLRTWNTATGEVVNEFQGHRNQVTSVAFSPDGNMIASGSADNSVIIWNAETGETMGRLQAHTNIVTSVAFSPTGEKLVSGSFDNTLRFWNTTSRKLVGKPLEGHTDGVASVVFSMDGKRVVSGSWDKSVRIWNAEFQEAEEITYPGHSMGVTSVAFSSNGKEIASGSLDNSIRIWNKETGDPVGGPLQGHKNYILSIAFSPDGTRLVSGSSDQSLRIWNTEIREIVGAPLQGHTKGVLSVTFSPDGNRIVSGSLDNSLIIWDARNGDAIGDPLKGHTSAISSVSFSPDGERIASASWDKSIRLWDATSGGAIGEPLYGHGNGVSSVAFSPDGTKFVSGSFDSGLRIWDAETGDKIGDILHGHRGIVTSVVFSPDGTQIASASADNSVRVWNAHTRENMGFPLWGHTRRVNSVAFSPDGKAIVSGSLDKSVRIWDVDGRGLVVDSLKTLGGSPVTHPHTKSSFPFDHCYINSEGWLCSSDLAPMIWIPPEYRSILMFPPMQLLINHDGLCVLDLNNFAHGKSWMKVDTAN
ncbi:WD40 repeat-like protein [Lentinula aciculospora]|uniref:WD40 repeat-like protein n=1 Tax=Lentinula aciculospora TaxID=153920 RepID=A0A9W9DN47_9AGAR|nr:WD40 repeat-like protein [Lentinula aciculospora]